MMPLSENTFGKRYILLLTENGKLKMVLLGGRLGKRRTYPGTAVFRVPRKVCRPWSTGEAGSAGRSQSTMSMAPRTPSPQEQLHLTVGAKRGAPKISVRRAMNSRPWVEAGTFNETWSR